jgi:hypothetical protein
MLQEILTEMVRVYADRLDSSVGYSGFGNKVNRLILEYLDHGGLINIKKLSDIAHSKAISQ